MGVKESNIEKDARSLPYFLTKSGKQGAVSETKKLITRRLETGDDFHLKKTWELPDQTLLKLYYVLLFCAIAEKTARSSFDL